MHPGAESAQEKRFKIVKDTKNHRRYVVTTIDWEIPNYKEDKSHNSAAKLWYVRNASLKKMSI